jgi:hypothetical protein
MTFLNNSPTVDASEQIAHILAETRSIFALMGSANPSEVSRESMSFAASAGQRLLDQAAAMLEVVAQ